jgi:SAM-dependent methyltransferase
MNRLKVLRSAIKAVLPFNAQLRRLSRRIQPYQDNPRNTNLALDQGLAQIRMLRSVNANLSSTVLEFGSGWVPVIPLLYYIAGAKRVIMTDVERLMDAHTILLAKKAIGNRAGDVAAALSMSTNDVMRKIESAFDPDYLVPWNSAQHPAQSVDIIVSRTVFEHVPPPNLEQFCNDFARILAPHGLMCHIVDNSDHWEHSDKTMSRVAFLRYDDELLWKLSCINLQSYQNRLRHSDYLNLFKKTGWDPVLAEGAADPKCLVDLQTMPLGRKFIGRDHNDLAILTSFFLLRRTN